MGVASLVAGIFAVILAAICTAPCFSWVAFFAAPVALLAAALGVGEVAITVRDHYRGVTEFPNLRHGLVGMIMGATSLCWSAYMFYIKGGIL